MAYKIGAPGCGFKRAHGSGDNGHFPSLRHPSTPTALFFFFFFYTFYFLCMCLCVHTWRSKGNFWELIFLLHHVGRQGWLAAGSFTFCATLYPGRHRDCLPEPPPSHWLSVCNVSWEPSSTWARGPAPDQMPTSGKPSATVNAQGKR